MFLGLYVVLAYFLVVPLFLLWPLPRQVDHWLREKQGNSHLVFWAGFVGTLFFTPFGGFFAVLAVERFVEKRFWEEAMDSALATAMVMSFRLILIYVILVSLAGSFACIMMILSSDTEINFIINRLGIPSIMHKFFYDMLFYFEL